MFSNLNYIGFSDNQFTGSIPTRLFDLPTIRTINLHTNRLDGRIPENIGDANALEVLLLSNNALTGSVPSIGPGQLASLTQFLLQGNQIKGTMHPSVCQLRNAGMGVLEDLWADCGVDASPTIECDSPACCTLCFPANLSGPSR
jgi:hypothetical protein